MTTPTPTKRKRPKKPKLPASVTPWPCAILAVDPGERSGWSIWAHGLLECWGECDLLGTGRDGPAGAIARVLSYTGPHIVVVERPFRTRYGTQVAVGAGDLVWRRLAERAGLGRRLVRVYPATWRARVLGKGWANAKREAVREKELVVASTIIAPLVRWPEFGVSCGHDAAAAILIGAWSVCAGEVGAKLPRPRKRAHKAPRPIRSFIDV